MEKARSRRRAGEILHICEIFLMKMKINLAALDMVAFFAKSAKSKVPLAAFSPMPSVLVLIA